jgi:two-component system, sensor histidine kinase and response regulator
MSTYSILVVDDEPDNFDVIEALLSDSSGATLGKCDYTLHYASCGQEAIAALDRYDPDAILLDVMMPDLDGFEVCQRIKAMPQWQAVPIIMVTGLTSTEDLSRCLDAGADDFISKPVNSIELRSRVKSMLRIKKQHTRIQSLSKLQRNNIHYLENNLNELRLDLAAGFSTELNVALQAISENINLTQQHLEKMGAEDIASALASIDRSAIKLDKLHQAFLFYLQLTLAAKEPNKNRVCAPKMAIEQIAVLQSYQIKPSPKLVFDLEDRQVAVTPQHMQYLVTELVDNALNTAKSQAQICIHGRVIDDAFHFWIDCCEIAQINTGNSKLLELIQFNSNNNESQELGMRLKIIKKIVEIYDGLFLMANTDRDNNTIYLALPLH